jgi:hypothetical protein
MYAALISSAGTPIGRICAGVSERIKQMAIAIIRHKVADYGKWRPGFDADEPRREASGMTNPRVFRSADDKNEIVAIFDVADIAKVKEFATSPGLRDAMMEAGVVDQPTIYLLESA